MTRDTRAATSETIGAAIVTKSAPSTSASNGEREIGTSMTDSVSRFASAITIAMTGGKPAGRPGTRVGPGEGSSEFGRLPLMSPSLLRISKKCASRLGLVYKTHQKFGYLTSCG